MSAPRADSEVALPAVRTSMPPMPWLVNLQGVAKAWHKPVFEDLDCIVHEGDCLGIIGPNGSGKSTLLSMIAGRLEPDSGARLVAKGIEIAVVDQRDTFADDATPLSVLGAECARSALDPLEQELRVRRMLMRGGFADPERLCSRMSGGWRKRLAICRALLREPDLVCFDEPTNHLDLGGVLWLEELLLQGSFTAVMVSHDRWFLERVATRTMAIDPRHPGGVFVAQGGYGAFLAAQAEALIAQQKLEDKLANRWRREAAWLSRRPKARTTKSQSRIDEAADLADDLAAVRGRNRSGGKAGIAFTASNRQANELIAAEGVSKAFGDTRCFADLDCILAAGERIGIIGPNGSGKTTLLTVLGGLLAPDSGRLKLAHELRIARFSQQRDELDRSLSLRRALCPTGDMVHFAGRSQHVLAWAKRFLFTPDQLEQPVASLSGGEQARVLLACLMCTEADVLLLDEPTNDLDIPTLEILEDALREFPGGVLLISHDRYLMESVCDRFIALDGQGGHAQVASYDQWELQLREQEQAQQAERAQAAARFKGVQRDAAAAGQATAGLSRKEEGELRRIEQRIETLEAEQAELAARLQDDAALYRDAAALKKVQERAATVDEEVEALMERWEQLEARRS